MKKYILFSFILLLVGCMSNGKKETITSKKMKIDNTIYGLLQKNDNGYEFIKFSTKPKDHTLAWVNIKSGRPNWNTADARCGIGLIKDRNRNVTSCESVESDSLFMESDFDETDAGIRVLGAVFTMGLTLTGASYDVKFNYPKMRTAYNQALSKINEEELYRLDKQLSTLNLEYNKWKSSYNSAIKNKSGVDIKIKDYSGLYDDSLTFNNNISYQSNSLTEIPVIEENSLTIANDFAKTQLYTLVESWKSQTSTVSISCKENKNQGFNYKINCPNSMNIKNNRVNGKVTVNINSKDLHRVFINEYTSNDKIITQTLNGGLINIINNSNSFISIDSISIYYNDSISSKKNLSIELSPESKLTKINQLSINDFYINWEELTFRNVDKNMALKKQLEFGFAIKYRVVNTNKEHTLYTKKKLSLYDYMKGRGV